MPKMWTLGGLSVQKLLQRTWSESWHDAVFGQAGRMAFYHFLAIFPSLLVFLAFAARVPSIGPQLKETVIGITKEFLPAQVSSLVQEMLSELDRHAPAGMHLLANCLGAMWAAMNGTWALVYGLNKAYEVEEGRNLWRLGTTIVGLMLSLALAGSTALALLFFAERIEPRILHQFSGALRGLEWLIAVVLLMLSFAIVYRFAPNLRDHEWKWSTPGAICALLLWISSTVGLRFYFQHVDDYSRTYGHLNSVAMLLLWLYFTNGAILIGGEMNSEIVKAAGKPVPRE